MSKTRHACDIPPKVGAVIELDTKYGKCTGTVRAVLPRPNCWVANVVPSEPRPDHMDPKAEWVLESAEGHRWDYLEGALIAADVVVVPGEELPPEPTGTATTKTETSTSQTKGRKRKFDWDKAFALFDEGKTAAEVAKELGCTSVNAYAIRKKWSAKTSTPAEESMSEVPVAELAAAEPAATEPGVVTLS